jgi:hypothetical protein
LPVEGFTDLCKLKEKEKKFCLLTVELLDLQKNQDRSSNQEIAQKISDLTNKIFKKQIKINGITDVLNGYITAYQENNTIITLKKLKDQLSSSISMLNTEILRQINFKEKENNLLKIEILNIFIIDILNKKVKLTSEFIKVLQKLDQFKIRKNEVELSQIGTSAFNRSLAGGGGGGGGGEETTEIKYSNNYIKFFENQLEKERNLLLSLTQSQSEKMATLKRYYENNEEFIHSFRKGREEDPSYKGGLTEEELLEMGNDCSHRSKSNKKKGSKKNLKRGAGAAKPATSDSVADFGSCSAAAPKINHRELAIEQVYKAGPLKEGAVRIHPTLKIWQTPNLEDISSWPKYAGLNEQQQREQIIAHTVGIGAERLLNDLKLKNEYVWETQRGLMMSCLVKLKNGQELCGKIHFVLDESNRVYHRMFFSANPEGTLEEFLSERGEVALPEEGAQALASPDDEMVGSYSYLLKMDGRIKYTLANNLFVKSYTIFSFNR